MKRIIRALALLVVLAGCATTGTVDPLQQTMQAAKTSYTALDSAIISADTAIKTKMLKGQDATNVVKSLTTAKMALDASLVGIQNAIAAAAAASAPPPPAPATSGAKP